MVVSDDTQKPQVSLCSEYKDRYDICCSGLVLMKWIFVDDIYIYATALLFKMIVSPAFRKSFLPCIRNFTYKIMKKLSLFGCCCGNNECECTESYAQKGDFVGNRSDAVFTERGVLSS